MSGFGFSNPVCFVILFVLVFFSFSILLRMPMFLLFCCSHFSLLSVLFRICAFGAFLLKTLSCCFVVVDGGGSHIPRSL